MRIGLLGDHADCARLARALAQHGHDVCWLLPAAQIPTLMASALPDRLPSTCQHVIPVQALNAHGVHLLGLCQTLWEQPALHTRLFTFLHLLHRAQPWHVLHAGGPLALAYLTVYTARFLAVPSVASYDATLLAGRAPQPFLWDWITRHVTALLAPSTTARAQGEPPTDGPPIQVLDLAHPDLALHLTTFYRQLGVKG